MPPPSRTGRCPDCQFDWDGPAAELRPAIAEIGHRFRAAIEGEPGWPAADAPLRARPSIDGWSAIEYLAHMADVVSFFDGRIARVLTEDRPVFEATMRFAELAEVRSYRTLDVDLVLDALDERVRRAAARLETVDGAAWQRCGIGTGGHERSVADLVKRLAHEGRHHSLDLIRVLTG